MDRCIRIINDKIEELQGDLSDARARTRVFIPSFQDCLQAYRAIENLELQIETLEDLRGRIEGGQR